MMANDSFRYDRFKELLDRVLAQEGLYRTRKPAKGFRRASQTYIARMFERATGRSMHQTTISGLLLGRTAPSRDSLLDWVAVLNTNTDYLLGLSDDDSPSARLATATNETNAKIQKAKALLAKLSDTDLDLVLSVVRRLADK